METIFNMKFEIILEIEFEIIFEIEFSIKIREKNKQKVI